MQDIICELQDMKHLDWAAKKMSPGTPGCFLKAYEEVNGKRLYYKLSKDQQYSLVTGFSSVINTSDKVIREKASKFIRSLLAEMSINQMYFVIMDLRQLEVGSEH